jgi:DNA-binding MarR family transcriptional regulator
MTNRGRLPGAAADPERLQWWRAFAAAHARAEAQLRRALLDQHDVALSSWRVLDALAGQPTPRVVGELGAELGVPLSSLSRQIDRLEAQALVSTRRGSQANHRHVLVQLTPQGRDLWKRATTTVRQTLRRQVLADIDPAELTSDGGWVDRVSSKD